MGFAQSRWRLQMMGHRRSVVSSCHLWIRPNAHISHVFSFVWIACGGTHYHQSNNSIAISSPDYSMNAIYHPSLPRIWLSSRSLCEEWYFSKAQQFSRSCKLRCSATKHGDFNVDIARDTFTLRRFVERHLVLLFISAHKWLRMGTRNRWKLFNYRRHEMGTIVSLPKIAMNADSVKQHDSLESFFSNSHPTRTNFDTIWRDEIVKWKVLAVV